MDDMLVAIEGKEVKITNPSKVMWPQVNLTKLDYIKYLLEVSPYLLAYAKNRLLTMIRWPHGIEGKSFYQKEIPPYAPAWVPRVYCNDKQWILLNDPATLVWVANQGALELHLPFNQYFREDYPSELILDLDPMEAENFDLVREVALQTKEVLDAFGLASVVKTSGATGLQIYVPLEPRYTYEETRKVNEFIARYITVQKPHQVTLERMVRKRGKRLYFDYLQLWRGRTLPAPYSVRARPEATVSTPLEWKEVEKKIRPVDFNVSTVPERIKRKGDLFSPLSTQKTNQGIEAILNFLGRNSLVRV